MRKSLIIYVSILVILATGILAYEIISNFAFLTYMQWAILLIGFVGIMISETLETVYKASLQITFSGAILIFLTYALPLYAVLILIMIYVYLIKLFNTKIKGEYHSVFDVKLIYNMSQFMILAWFAKVLFRHLMTPLCLSIVIVSMCYYLVNVTLLTGVQSAARGKFQWMPLSFREYLQFQYFFMFALFGISLATKAYSIPGLLFVLAVILPLQKTMLDKNAYKQLREKLMFDQLTGAYSRGYLEEYFEERLVVDEIIHIFFIDFDKFKVINDQYGHVTGDKVLKDFVVKIKCIIGDYGKIYRYGGDEFCVILETKHHLERLRNQLEVQDFMEYRDGDSSISYGFSTGYFPIQLERENTFASIMEEVDKRMYERKEYKKTKEEC